MMIRLKPAILEHYEQQVPRLEARRSRARSYRTEDGFKGAVRDSWPILFYSLATENFAAARSVADIIIADAREALFGEWRVGYVGWDTEEGKEVVWNHETARKSFNWFDVFRMGLAAACLIDDWQAASAIASYTEGSELDYSSEEVSVAWTAEARDFYIEVSKLVRDENSDNCHRETKKSLSERAKLLQGCVSAIRRADIGSSQQALSSYLEYYTRDERDPEIPFHIISIDGSILYHLIRHRLRAPELSEADLTMIARLD
jgi:hypothetical protein